MLWVLFGMEVLCFFYERMHKVQIYKERLVNESCELRLFAKV